MTTTSSTELQLIKSAKFGDIQADIYSNGRDYKDMFMTIEQLSKCLGYADRKGIEKMLERNEYLKSIEFSVTDKLSATDGKAYNTRLFNEDGIYEITFLSKTDKAKSFRKWVRGILKDLRSGKATLSYDNISLTPELFGKLVQRYFESMEARIMENVSKQIYGEVSEIKSVVTHSHHELLNGQKMIYNELRSNGTIQHEYVKSDIKDEIIKLVKSIYEKQPEKFENELKVLSYFYIQMRNTYGIVIEQLIKDYREKYNFDGKVSAINALADNDTYANIYKNLLNDYLCNLQKNSDGYMSDNDIVNDISCVESNVHTTQSNSLISNDEDNSPPLSPFKQLVAKRNDKSVYGGVTARAIYKQMERLEKIDWKYHENYHGKKYGLSRKKIVNKMDIIKGSKKLTDRFNIAVQEMLEQ